MVHSPASWAAAVVGLSLGEERAGGRIGERHFLSDFIQSSGPPLLSPPLLLPSRQELDSAARPSTSSRRVKLFPVWTASSRSRWLGERSWPRRGRSSWYEPTILPLPLSSLYYLPSRTSTFFSPKRGGKLKLWCSSSSPLPPPRPPSLLRPCNRKLFSASYFLPLPTNQRCRYR